MRITHTRWAGALLAAANAAAAARQPQRLLCKGQCETSAPVPHPCEHTMPCSEPRMEAPAGACCCRGAQAKGGLLLQACPGKSVPARTRLRRTHAALRAIHTRHEHAVCSAAQQVR